MKLTDLMGKGVPGIAEPAIVLNCPMKLRENSPVKAAAKLFQRFQSKSHLSNSSAIPYALKTFFFLILKGQIITFMVVLSPNDPSDPDTSVAAWRV